MVTNSYLEYAMLLLGWGLNNQIWDVITGTGLFIFPVAFKIIASFVKVRGEGADEGNKGILSLAWVENLLYTVFLVTLFTCIPAYPVNLSILKYDAKSTEKCGYSVASVKDTAYEKTVDTLGNLHPYAPLWWAFIHTISKGVTQASVASIPCQPDLRQLRFDIQHTKNEDPIFAQEIQEFVEMCFSPSMAKLKTHNTSLSKEDIEDVSWLGADLFLTTPGYYNEYRSLTPRQNWPYNDVRDAALKNDNGAGYPTCKEWWSDKGIGIRDRALALAEPNLWQRSKGVFQSKAAYEETLLRSVLSPQNQLTQNGAVYQGYGGNAKPTFMNGLTRFASMVGGMASGVVAYPAFDSLRQALPMIQAIMLMALIISLPVIITFSAFDPKTIATLSFAMFALIFLTFWWELARWIDSSFLDMIYDSDNHRVGSPFMGAQNFSDDNIFGLVNGVMFLVLPAFFLGAMGWAGIRVADAINKSISTSSKPAESAGKDGAKTTISTAKTGAKMLMKTKK